MVLCVLFVVLIGLGFGILSVNGIFGILLLSLVLLSIFIFVVVVFYVLIFSYLNVMFV